MSKKYNYSCNIASTLDIIGDRWTLLIIRDLFRGKRKFNELKQSLVGIAPNILSERLQHLEQAGIIHSTLYSKHPPRFEYVLTEKGNELRPVLAAIAIWGSRHLEQRYSKIIHQACGEEVSMTFYCPHCDSHTDDVRTIMLDEEHEDHEV
ncbi:MAG TPA: helix-turn-helix domain-containing protein [Candidatus Bathyarchaeia archaeon]|nr:helix-turn-helix domain-containing protein [Candidatus Bathyarchaeia archaeon]